MPKIGILSPGIEFERKITGIEPEIDILIGQAIAHENRFHFLLTFKRMEERLEFVYGFFARKPKVKDPALSI